LHHTTFHRNALAKTPPSKAVFLLAKFINIFNGYATPPIPTPVRFPPRFGRRNAFFRLSLQDDDIAGKRSLQK
ncbi:MAG: hypothetical protein H7839_22720, partial [Magnetococcus sp. YQC-5]